MTRLVRWLALIVVLATAPAAAQTALDVTPDDRATIRRVIADQLAAFQRDDGAAAFAYASPAIQAMFGTPDKFLEMVRRGYAPVYRPRAVAFENMIAGDIGQPVQLVRVIGPDGEAVIAAYEMTRLPDGSWRINGCVLLRAPDQAA